MKRHKAEEPLDLDSITERRLSYATVDDEVVDSDSSLYFLFERCNERYPDKVVTYHCIDEDGYSEVRIPGDTPRLNPNWYGGSIPPLQRRTPSTKVSLEVEHMESYAVNLWILQEVYGLSFAEASVLTLEFRHSPVGETENMFESSLNEIWLWETILKSKIDLEESRRRAGMDSGPALISDVYDPFF